MPNDVDDRSEWDRAWLSMPHRNVTSWSADDVAVLLDCDSAKLRVVAMTIVENPVAYADRVYRHTETCPLCGETTDPADRIAATIYPVVAVREKELSHGHGCWVHAHCLANCPLSDHRTPIPW